MVRYDEAIFVILGAVQGSRPETRLSEGQRLDAVIACASAFDLPLTGPRIDWAETPAAIAAFVEECSRDNDRTAPS